jgi:phage shock protein E
MKKFLLQNLLLIIGLIVGAVGGYLYYYYVGCSSGTCPITSRPLNSTMYGAVMGGLVFSLFQKNKNISQKKQNDE